MSRKTKQENYADGFMSTKVWYLEITSWVGSFAIGATHFYGRLRSGLDEDRDEIDLERELSSKEILALNKQEGWALYRKGDKAKGFNSEREVIEAAKAYVREFLPGDVLIRGSWCVAGPQEVLIGPESLKEIYREWKGWSAPSAKALDKRWDEALAKVKGF